MDKEELNKAKYEYDEMRQALPEELNDVMDKCFDLLSPFVNYIYPVRDELKIVLRQLQREQFPELNITDNPYLLECINDILDFEADGLSSSLYNELANIEAGVNKVEDDEQFRWRVEYYAGLREPRLRTVEDFEQYNFTYEEKVEMVAEMNAESIAECNELNSLKSEFVEVVQPILFKYHGERLNELDSVGWKCYGVRIGLSFSSYFDNFINLFFHLKQGHIQGHPGMNYFEYVVHLSQTKD
jgi:hypothetical protein